MTSAMAKYVDAFLKFLTDVSNWVFLIAGLAFLALSVGYSFIVPCTTVLGAFDAACQTALLQHGDCVFDDS